jgi:hypothetical protein
MKFKKNVITAVAAFAMAAGLASCGTTSTPRILNIRVWNDEFQNRFRDYCTDWVKTNDDGTELLRDGTIVKWNVTPNDGGAYQTALDEALANNADAKADDKVDLFLFEADAAKKYSSPKYALPLMDKDSKTKDGLGFTESELADQYQYTKTIVTGSDGRMYGTSWQAAPGLYVYRTDYADEIFGTHDPDAVQEQLNTWDKFNAAAAIAKSKGIYMLSGYDDSYRVFSNNVSAPWVKDGVLTVDPNIMNWVKQTKTYTDNGYSHKSVLWDTTWQADQTIKGKVLGFFYSTWGINFTLEGNAEVKDDAGHDLLNGKYKVCQGPASYYWGGTWLAAAKDTDNPMLVKSIMRDFTTNKSVMKRITLEKEDYTNTVSGMHEIATDPNYESKFLLQNHVALFEKSAAGIDMKNMTAYDQGCNEKFQGAMHDYFSGDVTFDKAFSNFETTIKTYYPDITSVTKPSL